MTPTIPVYELAKATSQFGQEISVIVVEGSVGSVFNIETLIIIPKQISPHKSNNFPYIYKIIHRLGPIEARTLFIWTVRALLDATEPNIYRLK